MRGKAQVYVGAGVTERITPAYAGKSVLACDLNYIAWDHPRLCGEKIFAKGVRCEGSGSPPPMRGKALYPTISKIKLGITPAYAGKSVSYEKLPSVNKDHPRLCGEKVFGLQVQITCSRITPAYAGKSLHFP